MVKMFRVIFFIHFAPGLYFLTTSNMESYFDLQLCTETISHTFFNNETVMIGFNEKVIDVVDSIMLNLNSPNLLINVNITLTNQYLLQQHNYIIIGNDCHNLIDILFFLRSRFGWNPRAKFWLITKNVEEIKELVAFLWEILVTEFAIVDSESTSLNVYTANYFHEENKCGINSKIVEYSSCNSFVTSSELFTNIKTPFINCNSNFFISSKGGGFEGYLGQISALAFEVAHLNVTMEIADPKYFNEIIIQGVSKSLEQDLRGMSKIGHLCPISIDAQNYLSYDPSVYIYEDRLHWVVPSARPTPARNNISYVFSPIVWICFISLLVVIAVAWWFMFCLRQGWKNRRSFALCFIEMTAVNLGMSARCTPNGRILKLVFIGLQLYGLSLSAIFQENLVSHLTTTLYEHQIISEEEIFASDLKIILYGKQFTRFPQIKKENLYLTDDPTKEKYYNYSAYVEVWTRLELIRKNATEKRHEQLHIYIFENPIQILFGVMFVQKGHPFRSKIDRALLQLHASGISNKIYKDFYTSLNPKYGSTVHRNISVEHLVYAFLILPIGIILGTIAFIAERCVYYKEKLL